MTVKPPTRQSSTRRPAQRPAARRTSAHRARARRAGSRLGWRAWLAGAAVVTIFGGTAWAALERHFAPTANTSLTRFDAIIVLGTPTDEDGNPTPYQLSRVNEAVREYERGVAPRLILSGGAAHNRFVEAATMARAAHAEGIPESAIFVEGQARDTIQNACYSVRIMKAHGWNSAEVISEGPHLARAGLILSRLPIEWRTHAAAPLVPNSEVRKAMFEALETLKTVRYLLWTRQNERCEP